MSPPRDDVLRWLVISADRALVAAIDIVDAERTRIAGDGDSNDVDDRAAVDAAVDAILDGSGAPDSTAGYDLEHEVLVRLAASAYVALMHSRIGSRELRPTRVSPAVNQLLDAAVELHRRHSAEIAARLASETDTSVEPPPPWPPLSPFDAPHPAMTTAMLRSPDIFGLAGAWRPLIAAGAVTVTHAVWATAALVVDVVTYRREHHHDDADGLAGVLDDVRPDLADTLAQPAASGVTVDRPHRYRFKAMFDARSGHVLWAEDKVSQQRWDYPVDHFDLPIPLALARSLQGLVEWYDYFYPDGERADPVPEDEWQDFRSSYHSTLADLRGALGSAYTVTEFERI